MNATILFDKDGRPVHFLFDLEAFWEFCCLADEAEFIHRPSEKEGVLGGMIDALESNFPLTPEFRSELKKQFQQKKRELLAS